MNSNRHCIKSTALSAYIDGELSDIETGELELHLETCDLCQSMLGDLQHLQRNLRAMSPAAVGFDLTAILQRKLAAGEKRSRLAPRWGVLPLSFAAALTVTFGILLGSVLANAPAWGNNAPQAMALFDPIPPGGLCIGLDSCYRKEKI
jgi:anti-sigma factor RsiW